MFQQAIIAALLLLLLSNASGEPLDCTRAAKAPATLICADSVLSALEKEAARLTQLAVTGPHMTAAQRKDLVSTEASYRKTLSACKDAKPCLQRTLIEQIYGLRQRDCPLRIDARLGSLV